MTSFILNQKQVNTALPKGMVLVDFIRYHQHLTGTKIGCREGDCGACAVLVGELINDELIYRSVTSCIMAIGNVQGKHVVTIEGLNRKQGLNPIQQAISDEGATQCGFCTPGFVVSLAGFCLSKKEPVYKNAIAAIDGNICRCTGYKSLEKAAKKVAELLIDRQSIEPLQYATQQNILPQYFSSIKSRLIAINQPKNGTAITSNISLKYLGGGTDLYVQQHEAMVTSAIHFLTDNKQLKGIYTIDDRCYIGGATTTTDLAESTIIQKYLPVIPQQMKLVSSTPIRNMATVAGNFINASPIGDLTIMFLALNAQLLVSTGDNHRQIALQNFYKGYKLTDKTEGEFIENIWFTLPTKNNLFNFEKVSKRTHLDIASVNTAACFTMDGELIVAATISAGGVGPVPMMLKNTSAFLTGKLVNEEMIEEAISIAQSEISPISDTRGSAAYKKLLLAQLLKAHFIKLFPAIQLEKLMNV